VKTHFFTHFHIRKPILWSFSTDSSLFQFSLAFSQPTHPDGGPPAHRVPGRAARIWRRAPWWARLAPPRRAMAGRTGAAARGRPSRGAARRWCRSDFRVIPGSIEDLLHYSTLYYINTCNIWKKNACYEMVWSWRFWLEFGWRGDCASAKLRYNWNDYSKNGTCRRKIDPDKSTHCLAAPETRKAAVFNNV
jgi:hypothetical protein